MSDYPALDPFEILGIMGLFSEPKTAQKCDCPERNPGDDPWCADCPDLPSWEPLKDDW